MIGRNVFYITQVSRDAEGNVLSKVKCPAVITSLSAVNDSNAGTLTVFRPNGITFHSEVKQDETGNTAGTWCSS